MECNNHYNYDYYGYDDVDYYEDEDVSGNNKQLVQIMKGPEFEVVKEFLSRFSGNKFVVDKNCFILYSLSILIYI